MFVIYVCLLESLNSRTAHMHVFPLGTFQPELKEEKVVYGLVHPINTFDSNGVQVRFTNA